MWEGFLREASPGGEAGERSETDEVEPLNMKFFKLEYKTSDLFCKPHPSAMLTPSPPGEGQLKRTTNVRPYWFVQTI